MKYQMAPTWFSNDFEKDKVFRTKRYTRYLMVLLNRDRVACQTCQCSLQLDGVCSVALPHTPPKNQYKQRHTGGRLGVKNSTIDKAAASSRAPIETSTISRVSASRGSHTHCLLPLLSNTMLHESRKTLIINTRSDLTSPTVGSHRWSLGIRPTKRLKLIHNWLNRRTIQRQSEIKNRIYTIEAKIKLLGINLFIVILMLTSKSITKLHSATARNLNLKNGFCVLSSDALFKLDTWAQFFNCATINTFEK